MPKIPTFTARGRPTAEVGSIKTNLKLSPTATPAAALLPAAKAVDNYYIEQRNLEEKTEANKKFFEIQNKVDETQDKVKNDFNQDTAINTFNTDYNNFKNQILSQTSNKRVKKLLETKLDIEYPEYLLTVKKNSRDALQVENVSTHDSLQQILMSKHYLASGKQKDIIKDKLINNEIDFSNTWNTGKTKLDESVNAIKSDLFITDVEKDISNKNFGTALSLLKDVESSKFLDKDKRIELIEKIETESQEYTNLQNIKDAMLNKRAWGYDNKDKEKGIDALALSGQYNDTQIAELAIGNDVSYGLHKNVMTAGFSNAATTGNPTTVRAGYETYKMYKMQGGLTYLKSGMKLSDDQMDYYDTLDFMVDTMGMDIRSAMNDYGTYYKNKNTPDVKSIVADSSKVKLTAESIANNFFTDDADNVDEIENLVKRYATILLKVRPSDQSEILDSVQKRIESNFKIDSFGNLTAIKPHRPDTHDASVKAYIKNLWDSGRINKQLNDFDDLIAVDVDPTSTTSISGIRIINKTFPTTPVIFKPAEGDFDENEFELGIFTDKQLQEVIYPFGSDARWESWKDRQNARKLEQEMLQAEIIASKTGMLMPIEE